MCGIHASISTTRSVQRPSHELQDLLCKRGPDHIGHERTEISTQDGHSYWISLTSTVLALRGGSVTSQPFLDPSTRSALCWNGEAWKIGPRPLDGNDGQAVFDALVSASSAQMTVTESKDAILNLLRSVSGPFAFFFLDKVHRQICFGRDRLGRRSLLCRQDDTSVEFASITDSLDSSWKEVEADGIYHISLDDVSSGVSKASQDDVLSASILPIVRYSWYTDSFTDVSLGQFNKSLPTEFHPLSPQSPSIQTLRSELENSLKLRVLNIPIPPDIGHEHHVRLAVLFSGGLDCTVLARMVHDILPSEQHIDLINVAFENPRVVQAASNVAKPPKSRKKKNDVQLDLTLQDETIEEDRAAQSAYENCPDRMTGRKAFLELQNVCPQRMWRFVAVDVPYTETVAHRPNVVALIHPHNTEMDLSIAYALYFAARGTGTAYSDHSGDLEVYTTPARVLLSGLGADELFGGYTRHATAFSRRGYDGLLAELELDVNRLGKRNLGRDDRVIANWGREARFPYLDEALVKWAVESPIWDKCGFQAGPSDMQEPDIEPGKKVLRLLAYKLDMHSVAQEKKRAIQFGARTAKMEVGRVRGTALIS